MALFAVPVHPRNDGSSSRIREPAKPWRASVSLAVLAVLAVLALPQDYDHCVACDWTANRSQMDKHAVATTIAHIGWPLVAPKEAAPWQLKHAYRDHTRRTLYMPIGTCVMKLHSRPGRLWLVTLGPVSRSSGKHASKDAMTGYKQLKYSGSPMIHKLIVWVI